MALLATRKSKTNTLIDTFLRKQELANTGKTTVCVVWNGTVNFCFDAHWNRYSLEIDDPE